MESHEVPTNRNSETSSQGISPNLDVNSHRVRKLILTYQEQFNFDISVTYAKGIDMSKSFDWNGDTMRPAASLIKLYIFVAIVRSVTSGHFNYDDSFTINSDSRIGGSGLIKYMATPIDIKLIDLIYLMMAYSDNIAANLILERISIDEVNNFISEIGASNTRISVPMMASPAQRERGENLTTTNDVATIYKGISSGLPSSISPQCALECQRLLSASRGSFNEKLKFMLSSLNRMGLYHVLKQDLSLVPRYLKAALTSNSRKRLTKNLPDSLIVGSKPGTGKTVFHDSCLLKTETSPASLAVMIQCDSADFGKPEAAEYQRAQQFCAELGQIGAGIK